MSQTAGFGVKRKLGGLLAAAVIVLLLGGGVVLSGCGTSLARTPRMSHAWSKGLPLGLASLNNPVGLAVDQGGGVYAVWIDPERDLRFVRLDDQAQVEVDRALGLETNHPQRPLLTLDGGGQLHLAWLDKVEDGLQVLHARLSPDGEVIQGATALSSSALEAGRMAMVVEPLGQTVEVFWSDTSPSRAGVYHAALDWAGSVLHPQELLIPDGLWPAAQVDGQGFVHLAWQTEGEVGKSSFHYAVYDPQGRALGPGMVVIEPGFEANLLGRPTAAGSFNGPWLGLEGDQVYLGWLLEVRERGMLSAFTFYQAFPQPPLQRPVPAGAFTYPLPEVTAQPVQVQGADPTVTGDPQFLPGQPGRQVLAFYTQAQGPRNLEMLQSGVANLQAGQVLGQEVVSATPAASLKPSVAVDGRGYHHLVWIDTAGFERYRVLYASTAPQVQEVLNPVTVGEVVSQTLELGFGALTLIGFLPLYLMWAVPSALVLLVFFLVTQEADRDQPRVNLVLWLAILIYVAIKVATAGAAVTRLSSGGFLTTAWLATAVRWLGPLLVSGLAVLIMRLYVRRTGNQSMFASFFVFVLADAVLFSLLFLTPLLLLG